MSYSKTKGEHKDGVPRPMFSEGISVAFRCVVNLNCAPQAEVPGKVNRPFVQENCGVFQYVLYAVPWEW